MKAVELFTSKFNSLVSVNFKVLFHALKCHCSWLLDKRRNNENVQLDCLFQNMIPSDICTLDILFPDEEYVS